MILGLTAAGYDLTEPLGDFDKTIWQGINGPIFALIALDSMDCANSRRDSYIAEILRRQCPDGGWNLTAGAKGDPDITGMALQALAKYQDKPEVKAATDKALALLSVSQDAEGGYTGWGEANMESAAQVLIALCELRISVDDARFVKNGNTLVDNILSFQNADGSFSHTHSGGGNTQMSSEQALCGLAAAKRAAEGKNSLYRMGDAGKRGVFRPAEPIGLPGKRADVKKVELISPGKTFADIANHTNQTAIEALAARGIIRGKGENRFDPDATMTRAEFAAIIVNGLGLPEKTAAVFDDVPASAWFAKAVETAYYYEIVSGTSTTAFNPGGTITRQEAAVMVTKAAKLCGMDTALNDTAVRDALAQFGDYREAAHWAQGSLAFCYSAGILDDSALNIEPLAAVRRCEIAETLYRLLDKANLL